MYVISCEGINTLLFEACKLLILHGIPRQIGTDTCCEYPEPVCFKMKNPHARWVIIPQRKWNIFLAYAESLWIAAGRNDLSFIGCYLNRMVNFSDDGLTLRGGYGPRIRAYDGTFNDYLAYGLAPSISNVNSASVDQFKFIVDCFNQPGL